MEERYLFKYARKNIVLELPTEYELKEIDRDLLAKFFGTIVPSLFWKDNNDFLKNGKGYNLLNDAPFLTGHSAIA